ncbi:MAG: tetratricopeptide repeat protein [Pseudomonadota bacterium]
MSKQKNKKNGAPKTAPAGGRSAARTSAGVAKDETDSFIEEVSEELQRDRLYAQFRKYGPYALAGIVALVVGASVYEFRQSASVSAAREAGAALSAAAGADDRAAAFLSIAEGSEDGVGMIARFRAAEARLEAGDGAGAATLLDEIANNPQTPEVYRDIATLKAVMARFGGGDAQTLADALQPLTAPNAAVRPLALELRAAALLELGEVDAARGALSDAIADETAPQGVRVRAQSLLDALGGPPEFSPSEEESASDDSASDESVADENGSTDANN